MAQMKSARNILLPVSSSSYSETYWFRFWKLLQKKVEINGIQKACRAVEVVVMEVYVKRWRWRST
jgi:hypothetical protein